MVEALLPAVSTDITSREYASLRLASAQTRDVAKASKFWRSSPLGALFFALPWLSTAGDEEGDVSWMSVLALSGRHVDDHFGRVRYPAHLEESPVVR